MSFGETRTPRSLNRRDAWRSLGWMRSSRSPDHLDPPAGTIIEGSTVSPNTRERRVVAMILHWIPCRFVAGRPRCSFRSGCLREFRVALGSHRHGAGVRDTTSGPRRDRHAPIKLGVLMAKMEVLTFADPKGSRFGAEFPGCRVCSPPPEASSRRTSHPNPRSTVISKSPNRRVPET